MFVVTTPVQIYSLSQLIDANNYRCNFAIRRTASDAGFSLWVEAMEALQKYGMMIKSPNGFPMPSPY
jgi:hypothetical protein